MGKLALYPVPVIALFVQHCGGHAAEAVKSHFLIRIANAAHGKHKAHAADGGAGLAFPRPAGEKVFVLAGQQVQFPQQLHDLTRQRHNVHGAPNGASSAPSLATLSPSRE